MQSSNIKKNQSQSKPLQRGLTNNEFLNDEQVKGEFEIAYKNRRRIIKGDKEHETFICVKKKLIVTTC